MERGIGIDASLQVSFAESRTLVREAAETGYTSAWTPSGPITRDGFQVCAQWATATANDAGECLATGIAVIPAPLWTVPALAQQAGTLSALSGGRFILGLGTGGIYSTDFQQSFGLAPVPTVAIMRDYLVTLRGLFAGEVVTYEGKAVRLKGLQLTGKPVPVPLYLAALGPQMLRLAGAAADGVSLNWTTPEQRRWCREQIAAGADRAGRDPADVTLMEYIRVCIDEDEDRARREFARAFMGYALSRPGASNAHGYRGHFTRMGFDAELLRIEAMRDSGASVDALIDAFPIEFLRQMGYFGKAAGAKAALERLSEGLDLAVIRIVGSHPGMESARAVMQAGRP